MSWLYDGHSVLSIVLHGSNRESRAIKVPKTLPLWGVCWMCEGGLWEVHSLQGHEKVWGPWEEETSLQCKDVHTDSE